MKKTALIGLMTLSIGGVAQAATVYFTDAAGGNQWTTVGNWFDADSGGTATGSLPGTGDDVVIQQVLAELSADETVTSVSMANDSSGATDSDFTIKNSATLDVTDITMGRDSNLNLQAGSTINFSGDIAIKGKRNQIFSNFGTVLGSGGSSELWLDQSSVFQMEGGTFTAHMLSSGSDTEKTNRVNLNGGTMTFSDVLYFNDATDKMDFNGGSLIVTATDTAHKDSLVAMFNGEMGAEGGITSQNGLYNGANLDVDGLTITLTAVPEPSTYALLAGCFGLTWVMLRRRR